MSITVRKALPVELIDKQEDHYCVQFTDTNKEYKTYVPKRDLLNLYYDIETILRYQR